MSYCLRICGRVLFYGILFTATSAGQTWRCTVTTGRTPTVRWEGLAELAADLLIDCTGGTGATMMVTVQINLNTNVTSRIFGTTSEALLLIDDPARPVLGQPGLTGANAFPGKSGGNSLVWENVPLAPVPAGGSRRYRLKNVRVNAVGIPSPPGLPGQVIASASVYSPATPGAVLLSNPVSNVAHVTTGLKFSVQDGRDPNTPLGAGGYVVQPGQPAPTAPAAYLRFTQGFPGAFRPRVDIGDTPAGISSPDYGTESGYKLALAVPGPIAGLADFGTRLAAGFVNIPRGVHVWVGLNDMTGRTRLTASEAGTYQPVPSSAVFGNQHVAEVSLLNGAGSAVWELIVAPGNVQTFDFPVFFTSEPDIGSGTGTVTGRLAPLSTVFISSESAPLPRFASAAGPVPVVVASQPPVNPLSVACNPAAGPATAGVPYSTTCIASGGQLPIGWSITDGTLPAGLSLKASGVTATISGTPTAAGAYRFTVTAVSNAFPPRQAGQAFSGTIAPSPAGLTLSCVPAAGPAFIASRYSTTCTASNGLAPLRWSIGQGALPAGLTLGAAAGDTVSISGTPSTAGPYDFTVVVADSAGGSASQRFSGTIAALLAVNCRPGAGPSSVGVAYATSCTAEGGAAPYTWAIRQGRLPDGLALNPAAGETVSISGTPSVAQTYDFTLVVTDSAGSTASLRFAGTVAASLTVTCRPGSGPSTIGTAYSTSCTAEGGAAPYTWSIRQGRLPDGLALSATAGAAVSVSGTPSAGGNYSFSVGATDASNPPQSAGWLFSGTLAANFRTYNAAGFQEGAIAADSIASLYGTGLAARTESADGLVTTTLAGASVKVIDSKGVSRDAQLFFASDAQINLLVPRETASGAAVIRVSKAGVPDWSSSGSVMVADVSPGIFVVSGGSTIPAAFYLRVTPAGERIQDYTFDPWTRAAVEIPRESGDAIYLLLYGTGFRRCGGKATATANAQAVPVLAAVAQGQFAGLDQVNIGPLPASLASGEVTVRLQFDGVPANDITVRLQ